jgi:chromosome segregation ATPase
MESRLTQVKEELAFMTIESEKCASSLEESNKETERLEITLEKQRSGFEQEKAKLTANLEGITNEKEDIEKIVDQQKKELTNVGKEMNEIEEVLRVRRQEEKALKEDFSQEKASRLTQAKEESAFMRMESKKCASSLGECNKEKDRLETTLENERRGFEQERTKLTTNLEVVAQEKQDLEKIVHQQKSKLTNVGKEMKMIEEVLTARFELMKKESNDLVKENSELKVAWAKQKLDLDRLTKEKDELGQQVIDEKENLAVEIKRLTNDIVEKLDKKSKTEEMERSHDKIKIQDLKEEIEQKGFESMQLQYDIGKFLNIGCLYVECVEDGIG